MENISTSANGLENFLKIWVPWTNLLQEKFTSRVRSLVVSNLRSEAKDSRFDSAESYVERWTLCSNCAVNV